MLEETAQEDERGQRGVLAVSGGEGDARIGDVEQAPIREADAVGVPTEVGVDGIHATERRLAVDDPVLGVEPTERGAPAVTVAQGTERAREIEVTRPMESIERVEELAAKQAAQDAHGEEEAGLGGLAGSIVAEAASGHDTVLLKSARADATTDLGSMCAAPR